MSVYPSLIQIVFMPSNKQSNPEKKYGRDYHLCMQPQR